MPKTALKAIKIIGWSLILNIKISRIKSTIDDIREDIKDMKRVRVIMFIY